MLTPLVRKGADAYLPNYERIDGERVPTGGHAYVPVHTEMFLQICRDYPGLPDARTLKAHEIRFFYNGLRQELKKGTGHR